ncbi:MAG: argininosuccinate lyase [Chitinispirillaceae bacterium]|nr:argininosuccinate lyase [Chitinispirillaceae bacterium]
MKMWEGRFRKPTDRLMEAFSHSLLFDKALIDEDIAGSLVWARGLKKAGVLSARECGKIEAGLRSIAADRKKGRTVSFIGSDEDIHMAVERLLTRRIGETGAKLHTGRSRNDQVATDMRLFVKKALAEILSAVAVLQKVLVERARKDLPVIMPAYTHLQQAQIVLLSHYWLSLFSALRREKSRIAHAFLSSDLCPLGAGACAGSGFPVDRKFLAQGLGFSAPAPNSIDAVAARDFILEALSCIASLGITLSRYAEDLIIWSSKEFGFIELDDAWSSGSSMMPQKKNPDSLELIRGKCGRFIGNYTRLAATLKGAGLAYCRDLQEDKEPLFDSVANIEISLAVFARVLRTLTVNRANIEKQLDPSLFATDVADYLVRKGVPFRKAHHLTGRIVAYCSEKKRKLSELPLPVLKSFSRLFERDVYSIFSWENSLSKREIEGGTGRKSVLRQIIAAEKMLK